MRKNGFEMNIFVRITKFKKLKLLKMFWSQIYEIAAKRLIKPLTAAFIEAI